MNVTITGKNIQVTESLKDYATEKLQRLNKYLHDIIDSHIILSVEKFRQKAEITLNGDGISIHGSEETENMYSSIDKVMDKLETQARRYNDKKRSSKNKSALKDQFPLELDEEE